MMSVLGGSLKLGLISFALALASGSSTWAGEITVDQAKTASKNWVRRSPSPLEARIGQTVRDAKTYRNDMGEPLFHVVRFSEGGFVVTSADDGVTPVIAFSEDEDLVPDEQNTLWVMLHNDLPQRLESAHVRASQRQVLALVPEDDGQRSHEAEWKALLATETFAAKGLSTVSDVRVSPLLQSKWGQSTNSSGLNVYNYYTPSNYVCGCNATAGAQIMRFHQYPTASVAASTYSVKVDGRPALATLMGGLYDWANMPLVPSSSMTLAQQQAIGKLTHDVGAAVRTRYTRGKSSAEPYDLCTAFLSDFRYASAKVIRQTSVDPISLASYMGEVFLSNLDAECPVSLSVFTVYNIGHQIVGDGYGFHGGALYIHLNMGWDGNSDVWYNLPNVDDGLFNFTIFNQLIFNIFPSRTGEIVSGRVLGAEGEPVGGAEVTAVNMSTGTALPAVTTNAKGLYAVLVPEPPEAGVTYCVTARSGGLSASRTVSNLKPTVSWSSGGAPGQVGNRWGIDLSLSATSVTVVFCPAGGVEEPFSQAFVVGSPYGALPTPTRAGFIFGGWWTGLEGTGVQVADSSTVTGAHTLMYAQWTKAGTPQLNQPPAVKKRSPVMNPRAVGEGASIAFSITADDSSDPDPSRRGMSNVTWYVDGVRKLETEAGAPGAITSPFTFMTDAATVQGVLFRDMEVRAVALDKQGGAAGAVWTVRVSNMPLAQAVTFKAFPVKALGDPDFVPGATASSGLPVRYASSNPLVAEIVGGMIRIIGAGRSVISASQPGNLDFKSAKQVEQTLTVKARLSAEVPLGGGTVTGLGLFSPGARLSLTARPAANNTFLRWEDGTQSAARVFTMPNENVTLSAWFAPTTNIPPPAVGDPGRQRAMVGVPFKLPLDIHSDSLPTVTVAGLPSGLSYSAAKKTISGVPTLAVTNKTVTVTAKNVSNTPRVLSFAMTVDPLPRWAWGSFNGVAGTESSGYGLASMSVTPSGGTTGKMTLRGTNFSFSAASYAGRNEAGSFLLMALAKAGRLTWPMTLTVSMPEVTGPAGFVPDTLGKADGVLGPDSWATLYRNVWRDAGMAAAVTEFTGYYTATLPGETECGSGYLTFTVDEAGGVKTAGKLADGTAVSSGGTLILDEGGSVWTALCIFPPAYKGGGLFGFAEFFKGADGARAVVRALAGAPFLWESSNPQATPNYGEGFSRQTGLQGGWYDTLGNLYGYYRGKALTVGTDAAAPAPAITVGTNRHTSAWWTPQGIELAVMTNKLGFMIGLSAPKAGVPVRNGTAYDYEVGTNTVGLAVSLARATGVFKGSFKAWFDYGATHTSKPLLFEGVLMPERESEGERVAGRGFFLWADKGHYFNPQGLPKPYPFNWSYDLKILLSEPSRQVGVSPARVPATVE